MKPRKIDDKPKATKWYVRLGHWFSEIPWYGYAFAVLIFGLNHLFYWAGGEIGKQMAQVYNWWVPNGSSFIWQGPTPKLPIDDIMFPLIIEGWTIPYISFSIFITFGALVIAKTGRRNFTNFLLTALFSWFIGFLILCFAPSFAWRADEGIPERVAQGDFWAKLYTSIFSPTGEQNWNLAPSFHCLTTGLIMYYAIGRKEINKPLRFFTIIWSILIFISTLYTKHHYFLDFVLAMAILLPVYIAIQIINPGQKIWAKHPKGAKIFSLTFPDINRLRKQKKAQNSK